jgi:uncharacterized tellurite resistance protein B-like protein
MSTEVVQTRETGELEIKTTAERLEVVVNQLTINTREDLTMANEILRTIATSKARATELAEYLWGPERDQAHRLWKSLTTKISALVGRFDDLRVKCNKKMSDYQVAEGKRKEEEQQRLRELAEEGRQKAEAEAKRLARQGNLAEAEQVRQQAALIPTAIVAEEKIKLEATAVVEDWDVEITLRPFLQGIIDGKIPLEGEVKRKTVQIIEIRESLIKEYRRKLGTAFAWPGVILRPKFSNRARKD